MRARIRSHRSRFHLTTPALTIIAVLSILALLLGACGAQATATPVPTEAPAATTAPAGTEAPAATEAPTATPAPTEAPAATEAPSPTAAPATAAAVGEKITISVAGWGPGEETFKPSWQRYKEAFEKQNPNIEIKLVGIPYENLRSQLIAQANAGDPPDIAQIDSAIDLELGAAGYLEPLDNVLSADFIKSLVPALVENSKYDGKLYAVPESPVPYILFSNLDLRKAAGLTKAPETVAEFKEQARAIAKLGKDAKGNKIWGFSPDTKAWIVGAYDFLPWFYNFGAMEGDSSGKPAFNSAEAVAALSFYKELADEGVLGPPGSDIREMRNLFALGQLGFYIDNPGGRGIIRDQSGMGKDFDSHYEALTFPKEKLDQGYSIYYAHSLVLFKASKHKAEAAKFLEFVTSDPETTKAYFTDTGQLPPTSAAAQDSAYTSDPFVKTVLTQAQYTKRPFALWPAQQNELSDALANAVQAVVTAHADPQKALDETNAKALEVIGQ